MSRTLAVPGNLLLFGEYAVLEQGGLGLACAIGPHVRAYLEPADGFTVEGRLGARLVTWTARPRGEAAGATGVTESDSGEFLSGVADFVQGWCSRRNIEMSAFNTHLIIDSSAFVSESGRKRGFGSSAAATVALCAAVCELAGIRDDATRFDLALRAHRHAQGGRGSGYDVAVSYFGGLGLFRGGEQPELESLSIDWLPPLSLYETGAPSSTTHAVSRYAAWKAEHREEARAFIERSNKLISRLITRRSWEDARPVAAELADLGTSFGETIGVAADITEVAAADGGAGAIENHVGTDLCKAVGAGAELAVCFGTPRGLGANELLPVEVDWEGCTWH